MDDHAEKYDEYLHKKGLSKKGPIPLPKKKKFKKKVLKAHI
jgi:ribosomal protein S10